MDNWKETEQVKGTETSETTEEQVENKRNECNDDDKYRYSLDMFDSEIQRMSRDADEILDSIRDVVSQSKGRDSNQSKLQLQPQPHSQPERTSHSKVVSNFDTTTNLDGDITSSSDSWTEDDDMADEVERLDAVTDEIRRSLSLETDSDDEMRYFAAAAIPDAPVAVPAADAVDVVVTPVAVPAAAISCTKASAETTAPPSTTGITATAATDVVPHKKKNASAPTRYTAVKPVKKKASFNQYAKQSSFATVTSTTSVSSSVATTETTGGTLATIATIATRRETTTVPSVSTKTASKKTRKRKTVSSKSLPPAESSSTVRTITPLETNGKSDMFARFLWDKVQRFQGLLVAVTVVWALILILLVHARYQLVDSDGFVRLPWFFQAVK